MYQISHLVTLAVVLTVSYMYHIEAHYRYTNRNKTLIKSMNRIFLFIMKKHLTETFVRKARSNIISDKLQRSIQLYAILTVTATICVHFKSYVM